MSKKVNGYEMIYETIVLIGIFANGKHKTVKKYDKPLGIEELIDDAKMEIKKDSRFVGFEIQNKKVIRTLISKYNCPQCTE